MRKRYPTRRGWRSGICGEWLRRKYGGRFVGSGQGFVMNGFGADMAGQFAGSGQGAAADGTGDEIGLGRDKGLKQW